ncbi:AfsR/SARP family transcriptional regulator [Nocardioides alcanivorans]|uniref:AfsR/SARP family transcriptional regulator n=1 Tax=Nocardioides alcanivorans TaxID=2897352 RepID=UPI001F2F4944|nr:BTAD domain-containing putative transcriptional regulator [Nocardioides alcanivorans]
MSQLEIRLLGKVRVSRDGVELPLPGRRVRALLVLLALRPGRAVTAEALGRGIWGELPPQRPSGSLHTCVARLRAVIGRDLLTTGPTGYTLEVPRTAVDVLTFLDALEPVAGEDVTDERQRLRDALELWVEAPFAEPLSDRIDQYELPRLVEHRLQALERLVSLDLATGRQARWLGELRGLVDEHPLRESLWLLHLRALHSSGRRAEALERYAALQQLLSEELGTDPAPALQQVHRMLLREPSRPDEYDDSGAAGPTPHQLPMQLSRFVGRTTESAMLDRLLTRAAGGVADTGDHGPGIAAVIGAGGVGKTSLVLHWARHNEHRFPGGQLFVDLGAHGAGPPLSAGEALAVVLRGLGVAGRRIPDGAGDRAALLRTVTAERRVLLVLDDARDSEQVRSLLPGTAATVVITSRSQLRGLAAREGVPRLPLEPMSDAEAVALLESRLGRPAGTAELTELAALCGHLPLALAVAAERAGRDQAHALTQLNEQLRDEQARLDVLSAGDGVSVRAVHDWSYKQLDEATARMFRLLGLERAGFISVAGAAALAEVDEREAAILLDRLTDNSLLNVGWPGWHRIHDLTRFYARDRLDEPRHAAERRAADVRLKSWYVHSARNARNALQPARINIELRPPAPGVVPQEFANPRAGYDSLSAHHRSVSVLIADAVEAGDHRLIIELAPSLSVRLTLIQARLEQLALCHTQLRAAEAEGDLRAIGLAEGLLGNNLNRSGDYVEAGGYYRRAREHMAQAGDAEGEITALGNEGMNLVASGRLKEGIPLLEAALDRRATHGAGERDESILNNLAWAYGLEGRLDEGVARAEEAIAAHRRLGNVVGETNCLDTLAMVLAFRGAYSEACAALVEALDIYRSLGDLKGEVQMLKTLGSVQRDAGWSQDARETWESALRVIAGAPSWLQFEREEFVAMLDDLRHAPVVPMPRSDRDSWATSTR